ncbi:hypothetical protein H2200_006625 [Cladophialophora chaetospira]|uniref:EthD domain-containing protein n=1 Tax=Cladophialophora chaetospira TaxID=386627 RepID=A0AA38X8R0_9EURO|nr:hypothetical protein H2200_006625 [Cladophialophora chaetospira]
MATGPTKTKVLRVSMYLKKKPGLSQEEFNRYWSHVHGPLVRPLVEKYGILKYTQVGEPLRWTFAPLLVSNVESMSVAKFSMFPLQYHTSQTVQQSTMDAWPELKALEVTPYDGVAEFIVKDVEGIKRSRDDPFFIEKIRPDEENFFDVQGMAWTIGWEEVYVVDGKIVPDSEAQQNAP